jgi:MFS family permease
MEPAMESESAETLLKRYARRNFWLNVLDGVAFVFGISMVSRYTVLPMFVSRLSSERWLQGLIPTLTQVGALLPALFMAPLTASLPRRKPMIMIVTIGERLPFLALGLILLLWPDLPAATLLTIFFSLYAIYMFSGGFVSIAWQDFIARVIPQRRWGMFFGLQFGLGDALGVAGAAVASLVLATQPFPQSVGILSLICFGAMIVSYIFLAATVEPPQEPAPRQPMLAFLAGIGPLLRRDQGFRRYLVCRSGISLGLVGHSFVTAAALERFRLTDAEIGVFTAVLLAAQSISRISAGALADRWGHKQVLEVATALGLLAMLLAVVAPSPAWFFPIFVLVGMAQAGYQLSGFTLIFSFSTPADRPAYIGVANAALAPVAAIGPLLAGVLAERAGYNALFLALMMIGLAALIGLHWRVPAPVRATAPAPSEAN